MIFFHSFISNTFYCNIMESHHIPYNTHHNNTQATTPALDPTVVLLCPLYASVPNSLLYFQQIYPLPPHTAPQFISTLSLPSSYHQPAHVSPAWLSLAAGLTKVFTI